jgi:hypothetical protein
MIRLTYRSAFTDEKREHAHNGDWELAFRQAKKAARMNGQTCTYESPEDMAQHMAEAKRKDPTLTGVELTVE